MATENKLNSSITPKKNMFPKIVLSQKSKKKALAKPKKVKHGLICQKCDTTFPNWWELRDHWRDTQHKLPEQCLWCQKKTFTLQSHLCKQHWNIASMCSYCGQLFMFQEDLEKHSLYHDRTTYRCFQCGRRKKNEEILNEHMYSHFIHEKYGCNVCEKRFKKKKNLEKHLRMVHFICQYCGEQCSKKEYRNHIETHNDLKCTFCKKVFSQKNRLKYHYQLQHGHQDFYKCTLCFQKFVLKSRLLEHMKIKHKGKAKYSCKICATPFLYWQLYVTHFERVHAKPTGNKDFKCLTCDFSTDSKVKLQWHVEKVSGSGFFCKKCQIQMECKGVFDKHMQIHDGEQVWFCDYCPRCYSSDNVLKHHISVAHQEQVMIQNPMGYPCVVEGCNRYYSIKNSLSRHMRKNHSGISNQSVSLTCFDNTVVCRSPLVSEVRRRRRKLSSASEGEDQEEEISKQRKLDSSDNLKPTLSVSSEKQDQDKLPSDVVVDKLTTLEVNVYYCNTCSKLWFTGKSQFRKHMRTHVKQVWNEECATCNKSLESPEEAARHYVEEHLKVEFVC